MAKFSFMYYFIILMSFLLMVVFLCGIFTYKKNNTKIKFLNRPLFVSVLSVGIVAFVLSWVPIFLKIWTYDDEVIKSNGRFIALLVMEMLLMLSFLVLSYIFAYDFGIALNETENNLQFFIEAINTSNITALEENKRSLKIVFNKGKKMQKKLAVLTPKAKAFVRKVLPEIIETNKAAALKAKTENMTQVTDVENSAESISATKEKS